MALAKSKIQKQSTRTGIVLELSIREANSVANALKSWLADHPAEEFLNEIRHGRIRQIEAILRNEISMDSTSYSEEVVALSKPL